MRTSWQPFSRSPCSVLYCDTVLFSTKCAGEQTCCLSSDLDVQFCTLTHVLFRTRWEQAGSLSQEEFHVQFCTVTWYCLEQNVLENKLADLHVQFCTVTHVLSRTRCAGRQLQEALHVQFCTVTHVLLRTRSKISPCSVFIILFILL